MNALKLLLSTAVLKSSYRTVIVMF